MVKINNKRKLGELIPDVLKILDGKDTPTTEANIIKEIEELYKK